MFSGATVLLRWSLRSDAGSFWPHAARGLFSLVILFALSVAYANSVAVTQVGLLFFEAICGLNVLVITMCGISYFSTAVTEEKDAGTMALLQLAGMNPLAITLGKSTSRLVSSLMLLVAQIPFSLLAVTLGGVLWQQVIAAWLSLAAWMVLVCNVALLCSARCRTSGRAATVAGATAVLFFLLPHLISAAVAALPAGSLHPLLISLSERIPALMLEIHPLERLNEILFRWQSTAFLSSQFWLSLLLGFTCFGISTWRLNAWTRSGDDDELQLGPRFLRKAAGRAWPLAMAWREFHFFAGGLQFAVTKLLGGAAVLAIFFWLQSQDGQGYKWRLNDDLTDLALLCFAAELSLELLLYSAGVLSSELRLRTHSALAMAPVGTTRLLLEKMLGCVLSTIPVLFWIVVIVLVGDPQTVVLRERDVVLAWGIMLVFSCHLAALLSLYSRWAALPLTAVISFFAFFIIVVPVLMIPPTVDAVMITHNFVPGRLLSWAVTIFSTWLFVILPMQLAIRKRWLSLTIG